MFYELRRYRTRPGRRDAWVRYMENVIIPFQVSKGMSVIASFVDEEDPDGGHIWIRRFDDEAQHVDLYAVYDSGRWQNEIKPIVRSLLIPEKSVITRVVPKPQSGLR